MEDEIELIFVLNGGNTLVPGGRQGHHHQGGEAGEEEWRKKWGVRSQG